MEIQRGLELFSLDRALADVGDEPEAIGGFRVLGESPGSSVGEGAAEVLPLVGRRENVEGEREVDAEE